MVQCHACGGENKRITDQQLIEYSDFFKEKGWEYPSVCQQCMETYGLEEQAELIHQYRMNNANRKRAEIRSEV